jgi:predicted transposase YbfD/YdcC
MPDLNGKLITGDTLNCQVKTAQGIVAQGGNYLLQVKDNQKTVSQLAEQKTLNLSPFSP